MTRSLFVALSLTLALVRTAAAQTSGPASQSAPELMPGAKYDARIPTLRATLGHDSAERISTPEQITAYLRALQAAAPDRTRLVEYARTWEGRPLHVLAIASPERIANLDAIKRELKRLADPRGLSAADADALVARLPVVVWLMHAVHGNEISSSDAALAEAYHLLAAEGDAAVDLIRREAIVLIDPLENPDGRARFVFQNLQGEAAIPDAEPGSAEHDEPWPGGRSNHYLFDMNRDWFAQSQPETRGRTKIFLDWFPQVVVDLHEMGGNSTYYFAPPADPLNPYITKAQQGWFDAFGRANAQRFDERGFSYFIREVYDSFYPGYGESWPIFHGAVGMTYEQASARGLRFRREDGAVLTYRDGVVHHFTAALTTAETAARNRAKLLRDFLDFRRGAVQEGEQGPVREFLLPPGGDPSRAERLARLLTAQGFEVRRADEPVRVGARTLAAGTFLLSAAQPGGRLLRNLLDAHVPQPEAFVKEQERRRKKRLGEQIYDVTAWSLPLVFDVEVVTSDRVSTVKSTPVPAGDLPWMLTADRRTAAASSPASSAATLPAARVGYVIPWGSAAAGAVVEALGAGLRLRSADLPFTLKGRTFPGGTVLVRAAENGADLATKLGAIAARHGAEAVPIDSAFVEGGISLGSGNVQALKTPNVLMAWDTPTQSLSAGWARYVLERRFGQPVTIVRTATLGRVDLGRYDVLVLPSGNYTSIAGDGLRRLKDWISSGGTLITLAEASRWAARDAVGLLSTTTELRGGKPDVETPAAPSGGSGSGSGDRPRTGAGSGDAATTTQPIDIEKAIQPERERPDVPGALLRATVDLEHWLSAGADGEIQVMVEGSRIFTPLKLDKGRNVVVYNKPDTLIASGLVWEDLKPQYASKAFLMHQTLGQGHVIAFAEDPNFRAFTETTELLFINAVVLGPAH
jgi:hypothetical protein